ncbi:MAG: hypothetical protein WCT28_00355 [Patescibacteria group bacterium]|jgi:hypothetical protein
MPTLLTLALSLVISFALATEAAPKLETPESHIVQVRETTDPIKTSTIGLVLSCQPGGPSELAKRISYTEPSFQAEGEAMAAALTERSDVKTLVVMKNPTAAEANEWFKSTEKDLDGNRHELMFLAISCPGIDGDIDAERLLTREVETIDSGGLAFADLVAGVNAIADSSVWIIDASRNLGLDTATLGPTADDLGKLGAKDALGISSSESGINGNGGLLGATAAVIKESAGKRLTLDGFYYRGIKPRVELELSTSMGRQANDAWNGNKERLILLGSPLMVTPPITTPIVVNVPNVTDAPISSIGGAPTPGSKTIKPRAFKFRPSHGLIAGGTIALIGSGVFAVEATGHHGTLSDFNEFGGESNFELQQEVSAYRSDLGIAIGLGTIGIIGIGSGVAWTIMPTRNGIAVGTTW